MNEILWLNKDDDEDENKTYPFQYMSSFCTYLTSLVDKPLCLQLIINHWKYLKKAFVSVKSCGYKNE